jgi:hypothetical protein
MRFLLYAKHMIYVHSFTVIKSTGVGILAPGTGGIPNPTTKYSLIDNFENSIPKGTTYTVQHYDFWISLISMNINVF